VTSPASISNPHTVLSVVGTRPNFMKMAPVIAEIRRRPDRFSHVLVHTGQHYDSAMSDVFLEELGVGAPEHFLGVGSGSHAVQTARVMERLETVMLGVAPDIVLVPGDVNSTLAATLVAAKLQIPIAHVEAGLRSFDRSMPEEINRVVADALADLLFIHSAEARRNLVREGVASDAIHFVGNTMIDTLVTMRPRIEALQTPARHGLEPGSYVVVTLHRPALVDTPLLASAVEHLRTLSEIIPVVFPAHPRTRAAMEQLGLDPADDRLRVVDPMGYLDFLGLVMGAAGVLTDSGGIQEETTFLGIPCFTLRDNTERPVTLSTGTNTLLGLAPERIADVAMLLGSAPRGPRPAPPGWDGRAAGRMVDVLARHLRGERAEPEVGPVARLASHGRAGALRAL
jgi:UDP-N-acetylglucosamine 2-epimerase (non-hydrolysing)